MAEGFQSIDHIAIAVRDLEAAIHYYTNVLGFRLIRRRTVRGQYSGMIAAEVEQNLIRLVLLQGTDPASQVCQLIENYGPGVAHIALAVDDVNAHVERMRDKGMAFDTDVIASPGLTQIFSSRDPNSGLSFELIQRAEQADFSEENVQELFAQLEKRGAF